MIARRASTGAAGVLLGVALLLGPAAGSAVDPPAPKPVTTGAPVAGPASPLSATVTLGSGDVVSLRRVDKTLMITFAPLPGGTTPRTYHRWIGPTGDQYVVPSTVFRTSRGGYDRERFNASRLAREQLSDDNDVTGLLPDDWRVAPVAAATRPDVPRAGGPPTVTELHTVRVEVTDRAGGLDRQGTVTIIGVDNDLPPSTYEVWPGEPGFDVELPSGVYAVSSQTAQGFDGPGLELVDVSVPELVVDGEQEVVLDGASATEATLDLGRTSTGLNTGISTMRSTRAGTVASSVETLGSDGVRLFVAPTEQVTTGAFVFATGWGSVDDDRSYRVVLPEDGHIPKDLTYELGPEDLAVVSTAVHGDDPSRTYRVETVGYTLGGLGLAGGDVPVQAATHHESWVSTGPDLAWGSLARTGGGLDDLSVQDRILEPYEPGEYVERTAFASPYRPGFPRSFVGGVRFDDVIAVQVPLVDQALGFGDRSYELDTVRTALSLDGQTIAETDELGVAALVPPGRERYELVVELERDAPWWTHSTSSRTSWTFASELGEPGAQRPLPLLQVDHELRLDLQNRARSPVMVTLDPRRTDDDTVVATTLSAAVSFDGGAWQSLDVSVTSPSAALVAPPTCPAVGCDVSLRVGAADADGNTYEQTVERAFTLLPGAVDPTATPSPTTTTSPTLPPTGGAASRGVAVVALSLMITGLGTLVLARRSLRRGQVA